MNVNTVDSVLLSLSLTVSIVGTKCGQFYTFHQDLDDHLSVVLTRFCTRSSSETILADTHKSVQTVDTDPVVEAWGAGTLVNG